MRYASIRKMDITNGEGIGISLFVQGCPFRCYNCFNSETWDFEDGKVWTASIQEEFLKLADKPYITRLSVLGGEPLAKRNIWQVADIVCEFKKRYPEKKVWVYTGLVWTEILYIYWDLVDRGEIPKAVRLERFLRACDFIIDGRYMDKYKDPNLKWRGSSNQNIIDVQAHIKELLRES